MKSFSSAHAFKSFVDNGSFSGQRWKARLINTIFLRRCALEIALGHEVDTGFLQEKVDLFKYDDTFWPNKFRQQFLIADDNDPITLH